MYRFLKKQFFPVSAISSLMFIFSCADETGYQKNAQAFYAKYAKSREVDLLFNYDIKRRDDKLYLQACQRSPDDTTKIWAIYQSEDGSDADAKFALSKLQIALTPFTALEGKRIIPEYEQVQEADTTGARREVILQLREVIRAFYRFGLREVICGGRDIVYLVERDFMMVYAPDTTRVPESVKNIATRLDANWYYQVSFEYQEAQSRRLDVLFRDLWKSAESKSDSTN